MVKNKIKIITLSIYNFEWCNKFCDFFFFREMFNNYFIIKSSKLSKNLRIWNPKLSKNHIWD